MTSIGAIDRTTIAGLLTDPVERDPDRLAVVIGEQRLTYRQLGEAVDDLACRLVELGVAVGDHVAILAPNSAELLMSYFAISKVGGVSVPLNHRSTPDELAYAIGFADVSTVLVLQRDWRSATDAVERVSSALPGLSVQDPHRVSLPALPALRRVVLFDAPAVPGFALLDDLDEVAVLGRADEVARRASVIDGNDPAMILFTSGTTSRPKAVVQIGEAMTQTTLSRWNALLRSPNETVWVPTPLYHTGAMLLMLGAIGHGFTFITEPFFDAESVFDVLIEHQATTLWPQFAAIVQDLHDVSRRRGQTLDSARQVAVVQTRACFELAQELCPNAVVLSGYGSTELNAFVSCPSLDSSFEHRLQTCGKPFEQIELATVDPTTGAPCAIGEIGEIVVRGRCVFREYYEDPASTAAAKDSDGWFHTGDLGVIDEAGELSLAGRKKDFLKVGGVNVSPADIESVLCEHPAVRAAEVVGMPDQRLDEVPVAFVELEPDAEVVAAELVQRCQARLAKFKVPRQIFWIEPGTWPMSLTKIDKNELRRRAAEFAASHA